MNKNKNKNKFVCFAFVYYICNDLADKRKESDEEFLPLSYLKFELFFAIHLGIVSILLSPTTGDKLTWGQLKKSAN